MFEQIAHEYVGTERFYKDASFAPVAAGPEVILAPGDIVTVESAWMRFWLPDSDVLFYVRSWRTNEASHVIASDIWRELSHALL